MKTEAKPGDLVEVHKDKEIYEGVLLEAPAAEKNVILIKLDNGYNIGFNKKDVRDIKLIEKGEVVNEKFKIEQSKGKPEIAMIITGGTLAARLDPKTGGVTAPDSPEEIFKYYPEVFEIANVIRVEVPFVKDSGEMDPEDWKKIAKIAVEFLNNQNIKGVIITHGTDSLHYTAEALSFFLKDLNKPVVLTYSQRSTDRASSDASLNLKCAAIAATSDIAEVMLVGHASGNDDYCLAMRGTKARKLHSSKRDAFKPVNSRPFAKITEDDLEVIGTHNIRNKGKVKLDSKYESNVAIIKYHPGLSPKILDHFIKLGYKGVVIEVLGLGQIAAKESKYNWIPKIKAAVKKGITICAAAQTIHGRVNPLVYATGRELVESGVIYLDDMLSETALVKLGWVLAHKNWNAKEKMLENISGEFSDRLEG